MNYDIFDFLKLIGSLGIFLYGMKLMSEALQKVAGDNMRNILSAMTSNRFMGVITGLLITTLVQSSSATTVMVVSFVNAGLLNLIESIGVIMGANVGSTVTAWIISILGFTVKMSSLSLPLIGISFPFLFSKRRSRKSWGELFMGFGLLFIGLQFLQESMPELDESALNFLNNYTDMGYGSYLLFLLIGTALTIVIQSSAATMALTLLMCSNGWIQYDIAASMVLGENIGTTVTANLAAMVANVTARRAALAHLFFNVLGVVWVLSIFPFFIRLVQYLSLWFGIGDPLNDVKAIPMGLSLFHTTFNILNVVILIGFTKAMARLVTKIVVSKNTSSDRFNLKHIKFGLLSTPDASLFQAKQEIALYGRNTHAMYNAVVESFNLPEKDFKKKFEEFQKLEDDSDKVEVEIANYLTKVSETKMTTENSQRIRAMFKIVSEIESVADSALNIAKAIDRRNTQGIVFPEEIQHKLKNMFALVDETLTVMCDNLATEYKDVVAKKAYELENSINDYRTILKQEHLIAIEEKRYSYPVGILYSDLFSECEKTGDYAINVTQAMKDVGMDR